MRGVQAVRNLQGLIHLALLIEQEVHQLSAEVGNISREETLVGELSLESSSSEEEGDTEGQVPGAFQDASDDFFAGL